MNLTKYFPGSAEAKKSVIHLLVVLVFYAVAVWAVQFLGAILSIIPLLGTLAGLIIWLIRIYIGVAAIVAVLAFLKVVK
ncbi:MAG: hypothetical protein GX914_04960 [Erysipelotrichia bacterium]|nr:hypothetical protein [Erysipelotrichia bacterium]